MTDDKALSNKIRLLLKELDAEDAKILRLRHSYNNSQYVYQVRRDKLKNELDGLENRRDANNLYACLLHPDRTATGLAVPCFHGHCAECEDAASKGRSTKENDQQAVGKCRICNKAVHGWFYNEINYPECLKCDSKWCSRSHPPFKQTPRYSPQDDHPEEPKTDTTVVVQ